MSTRVIRHVMLHGRVQGVGYRAFVEHEALRRGIEGWVRNRRDGSVEAVFAGAGDVVDAMVEACRRGPFGARVDALDQRDGAADDPAARRPGEVFSVLATV
jgi:acylphosphatase